MKRRTLGTNQPLQFNCNNCGYLSNPNIYPPESEQQSCDSDSDSDSMCNTIQHTRVAEEVHKKDHNHEPNMIFCSISISPSLRD